jgi:hypothetical protein
MTLFIFTLNNLNFLKYNKSDPNYFSDEWVSKMKADTHENWRLKLLNLKKILQTLTDYYSEVIVLFIPSFPLDELLKQFWKQILEHSINDDDFDMPNLNLIAESSNNNSSEVTDELCHLLQLVLGCAVNCERKSEYIETIMEMNETTQHMIMTAIQEVNGL